MLAKEWIAISKGVPPRPPAPAAQVRADGLLANPAQITNTRLQAGLIARGFMSYRTPHSPSGILCPRPPDGVEVAQLCQRLGEGGVSVSIPDRKLRISPHLPNALDEVLQVFDTLAI